MSILFSGPCRKSADYGFLLVASCIGFSYLHPLPFTSGTREGVASPKFSLRACNMAACAGRGWGR